MNYINKTTKYASFATLTIALVFGVLSVAPRETHAAFNTARLYDPLCLFACDNNDNDSNVDNSVTYNNSNNVNSNINSPGATINAGNTATPVIAYNTPVYNYDNDYYNNYPSHYNDYGPLQVSCYPMPLSARTGDSVSWVASAYGGDNSYHYTWTGTDSLSGSGSSISKRYYSSGYKSASVRVISGGQTVSKNCDGTVNVRGDNYNNYPDPYYPPTNYDYYYPLSVSCNASNNYNNNNNSITWNSYPSGGSGSYRYSWDGTENLRGSRQSVSMNYYNPGVKTASVTVYSGSQSVTQNCGGVNVGGYNNVNNYPVDTNAGLDVACYVDPVAARINQPVTWRAEVVGGNGPYTYSWTGTNSLSGSDSSIIKYYDTVGEKSGIVTVRSADGRTATRACSTALTVRGAAVTAPARPTAPVIVQPVVQPAQPDNNGLSAAALFSLKNVPWGWVAILVILVLFATVVYLIFNRPKI